MVQEALLAAADGSLALYYDPYDSFNRKPPLRFGCCSRPRNIVSQNLIKRAHIDNFGMVNDKHPYMELRPSCSMRFGLPSAPCSARKMWW